MLLSRLHGLNRLGSRDGGEDRLQRGNRHVEAFVSQSYTVLLYSHMGAATIHLISRCAARLGERRRPCPGLSPKKPRSISGQTLSCVGSSRKTPLPTDLSRLGPIGQQVASDRLSRARRVFSRLSFRNRAVTTDSALLISSTHWTVSSSKMG